uniref:Lysosomal alpha-glucosidase n=1 Tax=Labrus bergylta TaxID=56723 RepID=A0A3Q3NJ19_9LABR
MLSNFTAAVLLTLALFTCFYINQICTHNTRLVRSVHATQNKTTAHERLVSADPVRAQSSVVEKRGVKLKTTKETDTSRDDKCTIAPESRFDCGRDKLLSQTECEERGCCYAPLPSSAGPPWCFYPGLYPGYKMGPFTPTTRGQAATLTRDTPSYLPRDISTLHQITFKVSDILCYRMAPELHAEMVCGMVTVSFLLIMNRMNTTVAPLLFADQYLQLSTALASSLVSGLGEHYTPLVLDLNWTSLTLWNRDMAPHVMLQPTPALTWVSIGGILDMLIFLGPDPQSVVRQYLQVIGYPMMPPYWSLGFHLCRWDEVRNQINAFLTLHLQDVQWNDLDYAEKRRVFTFDRWRFADLPEMVQEFHKRGMKYILILDPGISSTSPPGTYPPFEDGVKRDVFIKNATGHILIGKVWPGPTAFPDFTNPETRLWWEDCIRDFHSKVPVDGLWIVSI